jgi:hypothetical protein
MTRPNVFSRLEFSFDTAKFGDALELNPKVLKFLEQAAMPLPSWQADDLANNVVTPSRYLKNPHENVIISLTQSATSLASLANTGNTIFLYASAEGAALSNAASNFVIELQRFKTHTDNISGIGTISEYANIPQYDIAVAIGQKVLEITYRSDYAAQPKQEVTYDSIFDPANANTVVVTTANNSPNAATMLGSFTSLYVGPDLQVSNTLLATGVVTVNNTLVYVPPAGETAGYWTSNISVPSITTIYNAVVAANTLIATRRNHDWNFFVNSQELVMDTVFLSKFSSMGNSQKSLVNNLIGTDLLIDNMANAANSITS